MTIMVSLVGEQPLPNLLPVRYLLPDKLILLATSRTEQIAVRLSKLVKCETYSLPVDPYAILETHDMLDKQIGQIRSNAEPIILNFTGGTKNMALAAYMSAARYEATLIYLQTEGSQSLLHTYRFNNGELVQVEQTPLPTLINNHDYIFAHVGEYISLGLERETSDTLGKQFEQQVYATLLPHVDEITAGVKPIPDLDIDLIVRCGNQVGFIEVKSGKDTRKGINQLSIASRREYFGIYTEKILVSNFVDWKYRGNQKQLAEDNHIRVIEARSFSGASPVIGEQDKEHLIKQVHEALGQAY